MNERRERPTFTENFLAPLRYVRELRSRGIRRGDLAILAAVGVLEGLLVLTATGNNHSVLENTALIGGVNLAMHLFFSLATSRSAPRNINHYLW